MDNKERFLKQYKKCLYNYAMRTRFYYSPDCVVKPIMIKSIGRFKPIFLNGNTPKDKLIQYAKIFKSIKIKEPVKYGFVYFIDKKIVPYNSCAVIGNMPIDYKVAVDCSLDDLRKVNQKFGNETAQLNIDFIDLIELFIDKICKEIEKNPEWASCLESLQGMKVRKAESLMEGLQRILFWNQLLWQTGHQLNGLGRLDKVLERFVDDDNIYSNINNFLKAIHTYYELKSNAILGDTGQIIILGGQEEDGSYYSNEITRAFINCLSNLKMPDPKILLRVSTKIPDELLEVSVECIVTGCGSPLISNDNKVIPALIEFGYSKSDAYNYGVSACWEPLSIGNSLEQNNIYDIEYAKVFEDIVLDETFVYCHDSSELLNLYYYYLDKHLKEICSKLDVVCWEPDPIYTLFSKTCLGKNKNISAGGSKYNNYGLLSIGLASVVDSFVNIEKYIFKEKQINLSQLKLLLQTNYNGDSIWQAVFAKKTDGFGCNNERTVNLTNSILDKTTNLLGRYRNSFGGRVKFGLSSPTYISGGKHTMATADGRKSGQPFSPHISREREVAMTDLIQFASQLHYNGICSNGNVVDMLLQPALVTSDRDKFKFLTFLKVSIEQNVFQIQFNVLSYKQLVDAKKYPEKYPNLIVRVWGFSAYFRDIPKEYQDVLIQRAKEMECA